MSENEMCYPKISIITVSYNAVATIEQTILSVINQTYENIEYIIIDGGSTDGTIDIIKKYEDQISYWISEPDNGIYDAMNKGIIKTTGEWIYFLNSGDYFLDNEIINKIAKVIFYNKIAKETIVLGKIRCFYDEFFMGIVKGKSMVDAWYMPPHQGMFIARALYKKYPYFSYLKILGDRELLIRLKQAEIKEFFQVNEVIAQYDLGGISGNPKNALLVFKESLVLHLIYEKLNVFKVLFNFGKFLIKFLLAKILSLKVYNKIFYKIKRGLIDGKLSE